jgi:hypothetical protein
MGAQELLRLSLAQLRFTVVAVEAATLTVMALKALAVLAVVVLVALQERRELLTQAVVVEALEMETLVVMVGQVSSFFATPDQFNISLAAQ